jgi:hypothetical protein
MAKNSATNPDLSAVAGVVTCNWSQAFCIRGRVVEIDEETLFTKLKINHYE